MKRNGSFTSRLNSNRNPNRNQSSGFQECNYRDESPIRTEMQNQKA